LWCGQNRQANARLGAALEVIQGLHEPALEAEAAVAQSQLALMEGSYDTSVAAAQRAVELLAAADGSAWLWHMAYGARGAAHGERGEYDQARADLAIAVRVDRGAGSGWDAATALVTLAWTEIMAGDIDAARVRLQEAFMLGRSESAHLTLAAAEIALRDGDIDGAEELCVSALERASRGGDHEHTPYFLLTLASCAARRGASERAAQLYGASQRSLEQRGEATTPFDADRRREEVPALRAHLGDEAYEAAYERGRSLTPADAFAFALARE
jgi:tetratricopeptide (TPR) repeat protein